MDELKPQICEPCRDTMHSREPERNPNALAGWALLMYVASIGFGLRLTWEALIREGPTLATTSVTLVFAASGTLYLFAALRSDR